MDTLRDQFFSPEDAEQWEVWSEELEPEGEALEDYLNALYEYYGNRHEEG